MPRDMTATGRYPPQPFFAPISFYTAVKQGDPEQLAKIMSTDPYFVTQDNGAGAPLHFATTYRQLDMVHHLLNNGAEVNQRDDKGWTPLHRAAHLAQHDGYLEIFEYLLSRGADPKVLTEDYDPYLDAGRKMYLEVAVEDEEVRSRLEALVDKYAHVLKVREPHPDIGCWWTLYDYGLDAIRKWDKAYVHPYPEEVKRKWEAEEHRKMKLERKRRQKAAFAATGVIEAEHVAPADLKPSPTAFLFPGQGSQAIGMLKDSKDIPAVSKMLEQAKEVLGYDLLQLCLEGPKEKLDDTVYSQPALYVAGLAAVEKLREEDPAAAERASATAGLSLGEYCALVFCGALGFVDGLRLVKLRGAQMAAAAKQGKPHGMLSVINLADPELEDICRGVKARLGSDTVCQLANYLFPQGRVLSGHKHALDEAQKEAVARGALKAVPLAVSGGFHTRLMQPASDALRKALAATKFEDPRITLYSNVTGAPVESAKDIPDLLARQLVEPVQWEKTLKALIAEGKKELTELGPGAQIKAMVKRISPDVWKAFKNVQP